MLRLMTNKGRADEGQRQGPGGGGGGGGGFVSLEKEPICAQHRSPLLSAKAFWRHTIAGRL